MSQALYDSSAVFYPVLLLTLILVRSGGHYAFLLIMLCVLWFGFHLHQARSKGLGSVVRGIGIGIPSLATVVLIAELNVEMMIPLVIYCGASVLFALVQDRDSAPDLVATTTVLSLPLTIAAFQPSYPVLAGWAFGYLGCHFYRRSWLQPALALLTGVVWATWTRDQYIFATDLTWIMVLLLLVPRESTATSERYKLFMTLWRVPLLIALAVAANLSGRLGTQKLALGLVLSALDYCLVIGLGLLAYWVVGRVLKRYSLEGELLAPAVLLVICAGAVVLMVPRRFTLPLSAALKLNREHAAEELSCTWPNQTDTIRLTVSAYNAYGLMDRQHAMSVTVFVRGSCAQIFPLSAGDHIGESGREMPLVRKQLAHPSPPIAWWEWTPAGYAEIIYRKVWHRSELRLWPVGVVERILFEYMLDPGMEVELHIDEVICYQHKQKFRIGRKVQKSLPSLVDSVRGFWDKR